MRHALLKTAKPHARINAQSGAGECLGGEAGFEVYGRTDRQIERGRGPILVSSLRSSHVGHQVGRRGGLQGAAFNV